MKRHYGQITFGVAKEVRRPSHEIEEDLERDD